MASPLEIDLKNVLLNPEVCNEILYKIGYEFILIKKLLFY